MSDAQTDEENDEKQKKKSKMPMIIGLVLALAGGGGGFYATWSGMILGSANQPAETHADAANQPDALPDIAFVAVEPITVSMRSEGSAKHLRFRVQLEVNKTAQTDVEMLLPRVVDVLNSYLRAIELEDIQDASALARMRAQMLRRVQIVTGEGRVNDLLIMEFVVT